MPIIMKKTVNGQPVKIRLTDGTLYSNLPIGFILPSFEDITPDGFLKMTDTLANRTVSRTTYKELFDWATARGLIGTGKPFGVGDGSTTFVIPDGKEIAFKGIGEYEGTVGAHVKSGGLANGEFLDDQFQDHGHKKYWIDSAGISINNDYPGTYNFQDQYNSVIENGASGRAGATTEVKSIGCHYYIKAKNIGVPADFISAMSEYTSYSTEEKFTGKYWIDGKPIYSKTVDCGAFPNNATKNVAHNITNLDEVIELRGNARRSEGTRLPLPFTSADNLMYNIQAYSNSTNIVIITGTDRSNYTGYVTLEYTKTTD